MLTKPNTLRLVFFLAAFAGALYCPVREILAFERPKTPPVEMRFRAEGCDPYDPMRGHYLAIRIRNTVAMPGPELRKLEKEFRQGRLAAELKPNREGFAEAVALYPLCDAPRDKPIVRVRKVWFSNDKCTVTMPFDKFFINEKLAKDAEKLLQNATRDRKRSAVLVVNIYADGRYAVKDLLIDGKPLSEHLRPAAK